MAKPKRHASYDDLCRLPEHLVGEIIDGELIVTPRPALPHAAASSALGAELWGPFNRPPGSGGPGGWWILDEPELHFGQNVLVPDLAGWRRERMPTVPDVAGFELAPRLGVRGDLSVDGRDRPWAQDAGLRPRAGRPPLDRRPDPPHARGPSPRCARPPRRAAG